MYKNIKISKLKWKGTHYKKNQLIFHFLIKHSKKQNFVTFFFNSIK